MTFGILLLSMFQKLTFPEDRAAELLPGQPKVVQVRKSSCLPKYDEK